MKKQFSWVHLSDLHVGQKSQWMWPNFKTIFLDDLRRQSDIAGPIDLVIFSGDLTQTGGQDEYNALTNELSNLWEMWDKLGQKPLLFTVPGNHDLQRPAGNDARMKMLTRWSSEPEVVKEFWDSKENQYIKLVRSAFANYVKWHGEIATQGIPMASVQHGLLPGDVSASLAVNGISVGLIGLNTSFLQLSESQFHEKLVVDLRQLNAITGEDPPQWCKKHDINFLVTHHPASWLCPEALQEFRTEIYPAGRFTAHLFGHMHDAQLLTEYRNGDSGKKSFQSSSLFGLEYYGDGAKERIHGYSLGQIKFDDGETTWKLWPRKGRVPRSGGARKIIPDHDNFELEPGEEFQLERLYTLSASSTAVVSVKQSTVDLAIAVEEPVQHWKDVLEACRYFLGEAEQHLAIRPLQRQACVEGVRQQKMAWVCADWGLGRDGFLWSIFKKNGNETQTVYRVDLGIYQTREEFLNSFSTMAGCAFPEFCKALALAGPSILLFDEAPVSSSTTNGQPIEQDAESLAAMVRDFCPDVTVILLSRTRPQHHTLTVVELEPLDEADTRSYLIAHPQVTADLKTRTAVNDIYRRTDGIPGKIDSTIRALRVSNLSDLGPSVPFPQSREISGAEAIPLSLVKAVTELIEAKDPFLKRLYFLLKVLSILTHGESVARLKRIDPNFPIHPDYAEALLDRDLIQVRASAALMGMSGGESDRVKIIFASRPVRDYVLSKMSEKEIDSIVQMATVLYFGEKWKTGQASLKRLGGSLTSDDGSLLENPHILVIRLLEKNTSWDQSAATVALLNLCQIYCSALHTGKHYRNCVAVCRNVLSIIPSEGYELQRNALEYLLAISLRMSGERTEARGRLEALLTRKLPKENNIQILLNLAMCLQALEDPTASAVANRAMTLGAKGASAIQLESIILEIENDSASKGKLFELEQRARTRGFNVVANNLALGRVAGSDSDTKTLSVLRQVYLTATASGDSYTAARAVVRIGDLSLRDNGQLSSADVNSLVAAYQYLYGEQFGPLFLKAHKALWEFFERSGDVRNLLSLFRHSSFIWRIHENEEYENVYVKRLVKNARQILATDILTADKNTAYFLVRAQNDRLSGESRKSNKPASVI